MHVIGFVLTLLLWFLYSAAPPDSSLHSTTPDSILQASVPDSLQSTTSDSIRRGFTPDSLQAIAPADSVTLIFGGDCLLTDHYAEAVADSVDWAFKEFDLLRRADIAMVNLECPVTTRGTRIAKPYNFRMHPRFLGAITSSGIDIVNIANNHIFDYDRIGLFDTISYLDSAGVLHVGAGRNAAEAHRPVIIETACGRVAFLGYYGGGEAPAAGVRTPGVARRNISLIQRDIQQARTDNGAQFVVINLHWGAEKAAVPDPWQQSLAHAIIDAGANAVVGHHPHVLQGVEVYNGGIIAYSLGNFIFGGNSRDSYDTALLEIVLKENVPQYRLVPVRVTDWQARELIGAGADSLIEYVQSISTMFTESIFHKPETK